MNSIEFSPLLFYCFHLWNVSKKESGRNCKIPKVDKITFILEVKWKEKKKTENLFLSIK